MPIIAKTGRKSPRVISLLVLLYLLLLTGAVSMIYPFLLMVAGSSKSGADAHASTILPSFLYKDDALYRKYAEGFFNESLQMMQMTFQTNAPSFRKLAPPDPEHRSALLTDWNAFLQSTPLPFYFLQSSFIYTPLSKGTIPHQLRRLKELLRRESNGNIARLNELLQTDFNNWNTILVMPRNYLAKRIQPEDTPFANFIRHFTDNLPPGERFPLSLEGYFRRVYLRALYPDGDLTRYNTLHRTAYADWNQIRLHRSCPPTDDPETRREWLIFVREMINPLWIHASAESITDYQRFLQAKYENIDNLNRLYGTGYADFSAIPLYHPDAMPFGLRLADWNSFISGWEDPITGNRHILPDEKIQLDSIEFRFRDYLQRIYTDPASLNRKIGTSLTAWSQVDPPLQDAVYTHFLTVRSLMKKEFLTRNFRSVAEYVLLRGRALLNTVIYCLLSIVLALIVNPLAAYALSRYRPPATYATLLFLMLTMSFPPMVTQIPVFLMLREFNLLNTFWALILPGMANGFSIFLLKGFFDSLPQDLYDSAALDGAGELTIFWQITMSLSKPILSVIALNAFTLAYTNFMMALLICQDENMWTIMPWLYQLQQTSGQGVIFASLLIAAIPTFLVFSFCQNLIIRGIVVPVEK